MKKFCPLASGSKGNAIYVESDETKLLIDAGISFKSLLARLDQIDVDIREIDAILVTHEHGDHVKGIEKITEKIGTPIFSNSETAKAILSNIRSKPKFKIFSTGEMFEFGDIEIHPFSIQHDTLDPVAFTLKFGGAKIGVCTDLGLVTTLVRTYLKECDYLYVEANHETSMVYSCSRPAVYKQRVLGRQGHLSNDSCASLLREIEHSNLKHIYLAHLSAECNNEDLALKKIKHSLSNKVPISIAYQDKVSDLLKW